MNNSTYGKADMGFGSLEVHIQVVGAQVAQIVLHSMMNKIPLNSSLSFESISCCCGKLPARTLS
jgi:hypothetical protein